MLKFRAHEDCHNYSIPGNMQSYKIAKLLVFINILPNKWAIVLQSCSMPNISLKLRNYHMIITVDEYENVGFIEKKICTYFSWNVRYFDTA